MSSPPFAVKLRMKAAKAEVNPWFAAGKAPYEGASTKPRVVNWNPSASGPNALLGGSLDLLRRRSRERRRNDGQAEIIIDHVVTNAVGMAITPMFRTKDKDFNKTLSQLFLDWTEEASADGDCDAYGQQAQALSEALEAGEVFGRFRFREPGDMETVPLQIQLLESEFCPLDRNTVFDSGNARTIQGIEVNGFGKRTAYWMHRQHPGDSYNLKTGSLGMNMSRVPAEEIMHLRQVTMKRSGTMRGTPWLTTALILLESMDKYNDAQVQRQQAASMFAGTIETDPTFAATFFQGQTQKEDGSYYTFDDFMPGLAPLSPMSMQFLNPGQRMTFTNPPSMGTDYAAFMKEQNRRLAAAGKILYEQATGDYCVAPETRVLTADLRWVSADQLRVGDEIIGFDESVQRGMGQRRKYRKASVTRTGRRDLGRRRIVTDLSEITVSDEHLFLCSDFPGKIRDRSTTPEIPSGRQRWLRADQLRQGDQIVFFNTPWSDGNSHTHGYLRGIADGEGHITTDQGSVVLGIAQNPGVVFDEIGQALRRLGFNAVQRNANGGRVCQNWEVSGFEQVLRFLGEVRPARLLGKAELVYDDRAITSGQKLHNRKQNFATVESVEAIGVGQVVTMETSTKTLVTEGLLSHNSSVNDRTWRAAMMDFRRRMQMIQWHMMIFLWCQPIVNKWVDVGILAGKIRPPAGIAARDIKRVEHSADRWDYINPVQDVAAEVAEMEAGLDSRANKVSARGDDIHQLDEQIAADHAREKDMGLTFKSTLVPPPEAPEQGPPFA